MGAVKAESRKVEATNVPRLKELLAPCPICGGTTDIDLQSRVFCYSCQQEWTLTGEAIVEDDGAMWPQLVGSDIESSPEIQLPLDSRLNYAWNPLTENLNLVSHVKGFCLKELLGRFPSLFRLISGIVGKRLKKGHK